MIKNKYIQTITIGMECPYKKWDIINIGSAFGPIIKIIKHPEDGFYDITIYVKPPVFDSRFYFYKLRLKVFFWNLFKLI